MVQKRGRRHGGEPGAISSFCHYATTYGCAAQHSPFIPFATCLNSNTAADFTLAANRSMMGYAAVPPRRHRLGEARTRSWRSTSLAGTTSVVTPLRRRTKAPAPATQARAQLERLMRDRLRKFMALLPEVLAEDGPDPVHDLRVWSRRLQQVVVALSPKPMPDGARAMVRALRRARRALGVWRDCDVLIDLLERKLRRIRSPGERRAWEKVRDWALKKREREMRRARRKLANRKLFTLAHCARRLADEAWPQGDGAGAEDPAAMLAAAVGKGYARWREALARARETLAAPDLHAFRIETKRLRYRIELVRDLDDEEAEPALASLRALQDGLGRWHDRGELARLAAEALADPAFLLEQPRVAGAVLRKLARDHAAQVDRVRRLLETTHEGLEPSALNDWISRRCPPPPAPTLP
jgi:CHAD domain-containing protein